MITLTKEWLQQTIAELEEERDAVPGIVNEDADKALAAMKIALASLEAEPVALRDERSGSGGISKKPGFNDLPHGTPLYAAPPAPVALPVQHWEELCRQNPDMSIGDAIIRAAWWNHCAAMLQGAEPVTTDYKLPFDQWLSQQTGTIDVECGCVMTEVFFHWLRVAYEAGNSPQCREISNSSTNNFRENAETSTKCWCRTCRPVTFADSHFVVCPECGNKRCPHANDHRHACTGSNEPGQEGSAYPAAPQQEVKP